MWNRLFLQAWKPYIINFLPIFPVLIFNCVHLPPSVCGHFILRSVINHFFSLISCIPWYKEGFPIVGLGLNSVSFINHTCKKYYSKCPQLKTYCFDKSRMEGRGLIDFCNIPCRIPPKFQEFSVQCCAKNSQTKQNHLKYSKCAHIFLSNSCRSH